MDPAPTPFPAPGDTPDPDFEGIKYREMPHSIEAEQALLGAILVNNEAYDRVSEFLSADHFYEPLHARIFEAVAQLVVGGHLATPVTLKAFFERDSALADVGGPAYLARLAAAAVATPHARDYGRAIYDLAVRRELIRLGEDITATAEDTPIDLPPTQQIENAEAALYNLAEKGRYEGGFIPFKNSLTGALDMAAAAYQREGQLSGLSTGLRDLDAKLGGLQSSDLIILAGRPSMGKTALATNIAFNAAKAFRTEIDENGREKVADGGVVAFFSLEMSAEQLATRLLAEHSGISSEKIRRGEITADEFGQLREATELLQSIPLYIDHTGGIAISTLAARARRLKRQVGLQLIVVDYLQLVTSSGKNQDNRVQEVTAITTGLKALAKELNVPIMALSQLSRQVEARDDKRPQLSDLRESGSIEQDADVVMFVYREEYYLLRSEPSEGTPEHLKWQEDCTRAHGKAEVIVGKQRHGPTGRVELQFQANLTRFGDLDHFHQSYDGP
ncbi:replicative DNA helicase [Pyruvatibacter mobilis]|uniref:replicative DNA helicase n=1 Tax=Pyruvatibacter mobilis TaxID=1712261 RepID=UPI003D10C7E6